MIESLVEGNLWNSDETHAAYLFKEKISSKSKFRGRLINKGITCRKNIYYNLVKWLIFVTNLSHISFMPYKLCLTQQLLISYPPI